MNAMVDTETLWQTEELYGGKKIPVARARSRRPVVVTVRLESPVSKARDSALIYAEQRLAPWAKWAKENRLSLGCPTISLLYKAMQMTKIGIIRGTAYPIADQNGVVHYPINAEGRETRSFRPPSIGEVPEIIAEVDEAVATVPEKPRKVLIADYFTYGPIEVRCKETPYKRARYMQLLESAKYSVYVALISKASKMPV